MVIIFFCIFAFIFLVLLLTFIVLLCLKKLNKKKVLIWTLAVLLPVLIVTGILLPFAYLELFQTSFYPKTPTFREFYGFYDGANDTTESIKLFEWEIYKANIPELHRTQFKVKDSSKFETHLKSLDTFDKTYVDEESGYTVFEFTAMDKTWKLGRFSGEPAVYVWYKFAVGSEVYKTTFKGYAADGKSYEIFRYWANGLTTSGSTTLPYQRFEVDDPAAFEEYLATVETYAGFSEDETIRTFSFRKDESVWSLINYKSNPDVYYWYYEARCSGE